jgi:dihydroneopterin aldolase/2-amino-4-hydroxy-6-hydroxymethyldihydropteridine diphosphokinase/dihydropteroate synthase
MRNIFIIQEITSSSFQTLEALTSFVASKTLPLLPMYGSPPTVLVRVAKPSALVFASRAEVQLRRSLKDFSMSTIQAKAKISDMETSRPYTVAIALGSNLGDTICNIEHALRWLENPLQVLNHDYSHAFVHVVDTSFLYESKPMYIENQPAFVNGACIVRPTVWLSRETHLPARLRPIYHLTYFCNY